MAGVEELLKELRFGIWQHYKGPLYQVDGFSEGASNGEPPGTIRVLYTPLELAGAHTGGRKRDRVIEEFFDWVCADPGHDSYGEVMTNGSCLVRRFTFLGPLMTSEMLESRGYPS